MSNHKTPLTKLEKDGLIAHGLGRYIGKPSQLADVFRQGVAWALAHPPAPTQQPQLVAWQPIETAPKDGRKVILFYLNRNTKARTVMARWLTDEEAAEADGDGVGLESGWYECIDNWDDYTEVAIHEGEPSHWMPLPKAPAAHGITAPATIPAPQLEADQALIDHQAAQPLGEMTTDIVRGCCEADKANPDDPNTICISVDELKAVIEAALAEHNITGSKT